MITAVKKILKRGKRPDVVSRMVEHLGRMYPGRTVSALPGKTWFQCFVVTEAHYRLEYRDPNGQYQLIVFDKKVVR